MSASSLSSELPLSSSLLLLLLHALGAGAQEFAVLQTPGPLKLTKGETLNLNCTLIGFSPPGDVRWYKGSDGVQPPVFIDKAPVPPRVVRAVPGSNTDYSIWIRDIQPKDAGTYYCVKYMAGSPDIKYKSGKGTEVSVTDTFVYQPRGPIYVFSGAALTLECTVTFPQAGPVKWFKGEGPNRTLVFSHSNPPSRVTRRAERSGTDFTIFLRNVGPEDAGVYYCVKQRTEVQGPDEDLRSGLGTEVVVLVGNSSVYQPRGPIYVQSGAVLTLECTVAFSQAGPVKWFKDEGPSRTLIFSNFDSLGRVTRRERDSHVDFTIFLRDVVPDDAGVYYCVKQKSVFGGNEDLDSGGGTEVVVHSRWTLSSAVLWVIVVLNKIQATLLLWFLFRRKMRNKTNPGHTAAGTQEMRLRESPVE